MSPGDKGKNKKTNVNIYKIKIKSRRKECDTVYSTQPPKSIIG